MTSVWRRFCAQAEATPDALALGQAGQAALTYAALRRRAEALGVALALAPGARVGLYLDKSVEYVVALLACWSAGLCFVPLEPRLPPERLRFMAADAGLALVLGRGGRDGAFLGAPTRALEDAEGQGATLPIPTPPSDLPADHPAYVIYTSGSTGTPKGVLVGHAGLTGMLEAQSAAFGLGPGSRCLLYLSISFDASLSDIGTALLSGASLWLDDDVATPSALARRLGALGITHLDLPPALLRALPPDSLPPTLTTLIIGGEVGDPAAIRAHAARRRVVNVYGPTEATVCVSLGRCGADWSRPLLGQPLPGVRLQVVAESNAEVAPGEVGELWIGGPCLALGYLNQPALTAQRFVVSDGERWYRSGDRVRRSADGEYEFLGRIDRQFKLHGRLVAPEEVEAALLRQPGVYRALALRREHEGRAQLWAYIEGTADPAVLQRDLAQALPAYLVPTQLIVRDRLPQTPTGKLDSAALATPEHPLFGPLVFESSHENHYSFLLESQLWLAPAHAAPGAPHQSVQNAQDPCDARAALLRSLFGRVLGRAVAEDDDFWALGGDSIAALEVAAGAEAQGLVFPPTLLWTHRTPRALAAAEGAAPPARSLDELDADAAAVLSESSEAAAPQVSARAVTTDAVLLTGATGHLGAWLLPHLLATGPVWCLIRASDDAQAQTRLAEALRRRGVRLSPADWTRVRAIAGDVTAPRLGLTERRWRELADVAEVHHLAASIDGAAPYEAQRPVNLRGLAEVLRLGVPRVYHASSLSVTLQATAAGVHGGYAQSKVAAEALLRRACAGASCHRLGLLTRALAPGAAGDDPLSTFLRGLFELGGVPPDLDLSLRVDLTPVDWAAAVLAGLRAAPPATYTIAAGGVSLGELLDAVRAAGLAFSAVAPASLYDRALRAGPLALRAALVLAAARRSDTPAAARPLALFLPQPPSWPLPPSTPALPSASERLHQIIAAVQGASRR